MKRKAALIITAAVMLAAVIIGGTMASFQAETSMDQQITTGGIGIRLVQEKDGADVIMEKQQITHAGMPGDTVDSIIKVNNTENREVYVRVTVNKSWKDAQGNKVFEKNRKDADGNTETVELDARGISIDPETPEGWIRMSGDAYGEVEYYYYQKPLGGKSVTDAFMESFSVLKEQKEANSNAYEGLQVSLEFQADAVQKTGAEKAILAEWGMKAQIDENGTLLSVTEQ